MTTQSHNNECYLQVNWFVYLCRRSLSLIESLLHLAEQGHYEEVLDMMKQPMKHCPEILFLGVIRTQVQYIHNIIYVTHIHLLCHRVA